MSTPSTPGSPGPAGAREPASGTAAHPGRTGGEDARVSRWVSAYGDELRAHLSGMLDGPADAEDVLQDVWLTAHRSPPALEDGGGARAWLYRVATNAALDRLARRRRRAGILDRRRHDLPAGDAPSPGTGSPGLSASARAEIRRRVRELPRRQREAVWLRWIEGRPYEEVASLMESTRSTARANVYQGLKRLRNDLSDLWEERTS